MASISTDGAAAPDLASPEGDRETIATPQAALDRKRWETLRARAALAGFAATLIEADDGAPLIVVSRWNLTRSQGSLDELEAWLDEVGARG